MKEIVWNCHVCKEDDPCTLICREAILSPRICPFKLTEMKIPDWKCVVDDD